MNIKSPLKALFLDLEVKRKPVRETSSAKVKKLNYVSNKKLKTQFENNLKLILAHCRNSKARTIKVFFENKKYIHEIKTSLKRYITTNQLNKEHSISQTYDIIQDTIKNSSSNIISLHKTYYNIIGLLIQMIIKNKDPFFRVSLSVSTPHDTLFSIFNEEMLKYNIEILKDNKKSLEGFFQSSTIINEAEKIKQIEYIARNIFPEITSEEILDTIKEWLEKPQIS